MLNRTCIVSAIRLTVVLGHGDPDFTWSYVPLGAYSAFEPLGGILCTNLPIIWHMWRKQRPLLPGSSAFKSPPSSTATPGSGESRRSRFARSIGLTTHDTTGTDSQSRTILDNEEDENRWMPVPPSASSDPNLSKESATVYSTPRPAQFWSKVERSTSRTQEMSEAGSSRNNAIRVDREVQMEESEGQPPKRQSWGKPLGGKSTQGMKKNVWEVRKK